jgi:phosphatidate cytidylyltransferase
LRSQLGQRLLAALALMAVTLTALHFGTPLWPILVALFGAAMSWEWARLTGQGRFGAAGWTATIGVFAATLYVGFGGGMAIGLAGLAATALVAGFIGARPGKPDGLWWPAAGALYVGLPSFAMVWLRADPIYGFATCLWLLALVWAIDSAAYFVGRSIGGPKLAPRVSPSKTWAGLGGGCAGAALVGALTALWVGADFGRLVTLSAALAVVEQAGDLAESAMKRHFGVKNSSNLIPGHGGILDRVDGLVAVALGIAALALAIGRSPLWP